MTDTSRSPTTQPVPLIDSIVGSNATPLHPLPTLPNGFSLEEEEDYTIKCICDYQDDDGNTVLCENCETWQHIDCYYAGKSPPGEHETHTCVDCEYKPLDGKGATERQRAKREDRGLGDRKTKKQATGKSHKKKIKPLESHHNLTNGWLPDKHEIASPRNHINGGSKEQIAKRHKPSHKASNSVHSQNVPLKLPSQSRRSTSASHTLQSPSKTSNHHAPSDHKDEPFSNEFMHLYDNDPGDTPMQANLFNDIRITNNLALWSTDVEALTEAAHGKTPQDIFLRYDQSLDSLPQQCLNKCIKVGSEIECHGLNPRWIYLTADSHIPQGTVVGELRGKIGHMDDYTKDEANRWEYLRHPLPFVFFHNRLPIYIDTRQEGTLLRYMRRSCQPNLVMKTFLEGSDYRFCWVANTAVDPGAELTIPWTLDEHVRAYTQKLSGGLKYEGSADTDESYVTGYCARVLADFGGCACPNPEQCVLKSYASRNRVVSVDQCQTNGKPKRSRKHATNSSAHGTARDTASRSGSEALKYQDDDDQDDGQTTSASSRSKPQSRDMTPSQQPPNNSKTTLFGTEISDREKRKIAQLEKMEQDKNQPPPKKKKRNSGGSTLGTPVAATSVSDPTLSVFDHADDSI